MPLVRSSGYIQFQLCAANLLKDKSYNRQTVAINAHFDPNLYQPTGILNNREQLERSRKEWILLKIAHRLNISF